jgi:hypothetical protein
VLAKVAPRSGIVRPSLVVEVTGDTSAMDDEDEDDDAEDEEAPG